MSDNHQEILEDIQERAEALREQALDYHAEPRPGKIEVTPSKKVKDQDDLSLAYTPGVAEPVREIARDAEAAYRYTAKGNLVGVITDGSAVLGLGRAGALAGKPVMEGKANLFKLFADIDVFDIEVDAPSPEAFVETVVNIAPTFGGINLEDIAAPHCFQIEDSLRGRLDIPVFHDDQHGTAVVTCAGLKNALEIQGKPLESVRVVIVGAGAAGIAIAKLLVCMGLKRNQLVMVDSRGVIHAEREDLNVYKQNFAIETSLRTLPEAMLGTDVLIGVSGPGVVTPEMVKTMAKRSIIFALSNPDPEIYPEEVKAVRPYAVVATGRSDYPNQINNALCFPFLFRGVLDARVKQIDQHILLAVVDALAELAREPVPKEVLAAYGVKKMCFGEDYILPKQFDPRLKSWVVERIKAVVEAGEAAQNICAS